MLLWPNSEMSARQYRRVQSVSEHQVNISPLHDKGEASWCQEERELQLIFPLESSDDVLWMTEK